MSRRPARSSGSSVRDQRMRIAPSTKALSEAFPSSASARSSSRFGAARETTVLTLEEERRMRDSWLGLVDSVLRPARPHLERCLPERERHLETRRLFGEARARAIASCERRIEAARAAVFAANDGVVGARMTDLEREWRSLSRPDTDAGLMDLWARIAPSSWIDRKRWRDSSAADRLDAAIALAADVDGVEAAESAIRAFGAALVPWGTRIGSSIRWQPFERDADCTTDLLAEPLRAALEAISPSDATPVVLARAQDLEHDVHGAARARLPDRPLLARGLARAAFVDSVWRAAVLDGPTDPIAPLRALWATGYAISAIDSSGVTLEIPRLPA